MCSGEKFFQGGTAFDRIRQLKTTCIRADAQFPQFRAHFAAADELTFAGSAGPRRSFRQIPTPFLILHFFDPGQDFTAVPMLYCLSKYSFKKGVPMPVRLNPVAMSALLLGLFAGTSSAMECNVCHSKNPAMVKMHKSTQANGISCFDCHKIGEKLMGKSQPKDKESLLKRRTAEAVCKGCHK